MEQANEAIVFAGAIATEYIQRPLVEMRHRLDADEFGALSEAAALMVSRRDEALMWTEEASAACQIFADYLEEALRSMAARR